MLGRLPAVDSALDHTISESNQGAKAAESILNLLSNLWESQNSWKHLVFTKTFSAWLGRMPGVDPHLDHIISRLVKAKKAKVFLTNGLNLFHSFCFDFLNGIAAWHFILLNTSRMEQYMLDIFGSSYLSI